MKTERITVDGKVIDVAIFSMPMFHADWHKVEDLGLEYVCSTSEGSDYWDNDMIFCKPENEEKVKGHFTDY